MSKRKNTRKKARPQADKTCSSSVETGPENHVCTECGKTAEYPSGVCRPKSR